MNIPITLTNNAIKAIEAKIITNNAKALLLDIKNSGCSGHSYQMSYVDVVDNIDDYDVIEVKPAKIIIPKTVSWMLLGCEIDYIEDDLGNERFIFNNPNETATCGCGQSFKV